MSRHLDGSPKPPDPIWLRQHHTLTMRCACGHGARARVGDLARRGGCGGHERMWELVARLTCSRCGARGPAVDLD